ncbi:choice-of-anchor D domain-containing protein [Algibacter sp. 2305UL17-15]|uniref:choice-of-anchor D domain-containing protein n=1 Tax=Algibacter sp. 2305UL17-15 TaxID=3231268 RepID=UPI00345A03F4
MKKFLSILVIFCLTFSCIPDTAKNDEPEPSNNSLENLLIFETEDAQFPYVFVHKNRERLFLRDLDENGNYDGVFYKNGTYEEYILLDELTGLPKSKKNNEGLSVLYNYKEDNKIVDLAITLNGETSFVTNLDMSSTIGLIANKNGALKKTDKEKIRDAASAIEQVADVISCIEGLTIWGVGSIGSVGVGTIPLGWLATFKCTPVVLEITQGILEARDTEIGKAIANDLDKVNGFIDVLTCRTGLIGCTAFVVAEATELQLKLEELQRKAEELQKELEEIQKRSAEVVILDNLNFGEVELDETKTQTLQIFNRGDEPVTITNLEINNNIEQFKVNTAFPFTLSPTGSDGFSAEISVSFAPKTSSGNFNTFIKISNDKYEPFDVKSITASAINEDGAKIKLNGTLNYNGITVNQPHSEFFDIQNPNLNDILNIQSIEFNFGDLPSDKFSVNGWKSGDILPGKKQEIEVVFEPSDVIEYNGFVVVNNNLDDVNNKIPIYGKGKKLEIRLAGDLDFGQVSVGQSKTLSLDIENPNLNDDIIVNNIVLPQGYVADWTSGTIRPSMRQPVSITFSPEQATEYSGVLEVLNNIDETNNKLTITGRGVTNQNILDGNWIATWELTTCEPTATSNDTSCLNHQNTRPYVFIPTPNGSCQELLCGIMDFNNIRNGNSDGEVINKWEYDGTNVTVDIRSNSNGFFFLTRTFKYSGVLDQNTNTIIGQYESEYTGGGTAGWKNKATGTLTLKKE